MRPGLVVAGYGLAWVASGATVALFDRQFSPADNQTMGGMIAGGEMLLGLAVFAIGSLAPTGLALWFLRGSRRFWSAFSGLGLVFAIVGLAAALAPLATRESVDRAPLLALVDLLGVVQMLGSPIGIGGFVLFAVLAPAPDLRRRMLIALAIEVVIAGCGLLYFLSPAPQI
jgi:hypothetical protein